MKAKTKKIALLSLILIILIIFLAIYLKPKNTNVVIDTTPFRDANGKLVVVTTLFPVYDFAKIVGGDKANVSLILPFGHESHAYQPSEPDIQVIKQSAIFFYTSSLMEKWAPDLTKRLSAKTKAMATAENLNDSSLDPHVWLDFTKAMQMVDNISAEYKLVDPKNSDYYEQNANSYKQKLAELDTKYQAALKDCKFQEFISGGHFTFGYLAKHYNLKYQAAQGFVPDTSLDTEKVLRLSKELKDSGQPYVYYEELIMPYLAELMHQTSASARLMPLNAAHNVGKYDVETGTTFISLMETDLNILKTGLGCK